MFLLGGRGRYGDGPYNCNGGDGGELAILSNLCFSVLKPSNAKCTQNTSVVGYGGGPSGPGGYNGGNRGYNQGYNQGGGGGYGGNGYDSNGYGKVPLHFFCYLINYLLCSRCE